MGIFSAIFLFKRQRNPFLLAAYCYSWNCWPTFFFYKKNVKNAFFKIKNVKNVFYIYVKYHYSFLVRVQVTIVGDLENDEPENDAPNCSSDSKKTVLSQGGPRDAAVNFSTYQSLQKNLSRSRTTSPNFA